MDNLEQPLVSAIEEEDERQFPSHQTTNQDTPPINGTRDFFTVSYYEFKKLWFLAGPAIFTSICRYSLGAITQVCAGQLGTLQLAAVSVENSVIAGFSFGIMLGMGSALETLCGQAYGAGQIDMLGIYMQRSWVLLITTSLLLSSIYIFATPFLLLIGQTQQISKAAGTFALWMLPQLFAYSMNFPIAKFLQAQSKIMVMALIAATALALHTLFSWLLILKLEWGLVGAALVLNSSWWFIVGAQLVYIFGGACGRAWSGFSWKAFHNLGNFAGVSLASAVMLCLEMWYFNVLILFAGYLKNAEVSVAALSICMNILGWTVMVAIGMNAAVSVRISNELGAAHPRKAKFSLMVAVSSSLTIGMVLAIILLTTKDSYPSLFSNSEHVKDLVKELNLLLAVCIVINCVQPVLTGVAVGAGWQVIVAYVNLACYYLFGLPIGLILGYKMEMGVKGIWYGMMSGTILQTCVLSGMIYRTNWKNEALIVEDRIRKWGGHSDSKSNYFSEK